MIVWRNVRILLTLVTTFEGYIGCFLLMTWWLLKEPFGFSDLDDDQRALVVFRKLIRNFSRRRVGSSFPSSLKNEGALASRGFSRTGNLICLSTLLRLTILRRQEPSPAFSKSSFETDTKDLLSASLPKRGKRARTTS